MLKLVLVFSTHMLGAAAPQPEDPAYDAAKQHFNEGRYAEAAAGFEQLWKESPDPKYLHYAAIAEAALGRDTHAIVNWQRVVQETDATKKISADAKDFLVEAYKRAPAVTLNMAPDAAGEAWSIELTPEQGPSIAMLLSEARRPDSPGNVIHLAPGKWTITLTGSRKFQSTTAEVTVTEQTPTSVELQPARVTGVVELQVQPFVEGATAVFCDVQGVQPEVEHTLSDGSAVTLPEGQWVVTIEAQGHHPYTARVESTAGRLTGLPVTLTPSGVGGPDSTQNRKVPHPKLALGLGIGAGLAAVAGGVLVGVGESGISPSAERPDMYRTGEDGVSAGTNQVAWGGAMLGGAVGLGTTAVMAKVGVRSKRWFIPLSLGLASAIGGTVVYVLTTSKHSGKFTNQDYLAQPEVDTMRAEIYGSSLLIGLGSGLLIGSVSGLIVGRKASPGDRSTMSFNFSPRGGSLKVSF